jgi:hypothetical protein
MCPLNLEGRCIVYAHRPMICRMHGIPHELQRPDGRRIRGPGCEAFACSRHDPDDFLDRTPFYRDMAALEGELRRTIRFRAKIRMTVAQMVRQLRAKQAPGGGENEIP